MLSKDEHFLWKEARQVCSCFQWEEQGGSLPRREMRLDQVMVGTWKGFLGELECEVFLTD